MACHGSVDDFLSGIPAVDSCDEVLSKIQQGSQNYQELYDAFFKQLETVLGAQTHEDTKAQYAYIASKLEAFKQALERIHSALSVMFLLVDILDSYRVGERLIFEFPVLYRFKTTWSEQLLPPKEQITLLLNSLASFNTNFSPEMPDCLEFMGLKVQTTALRNFCSIDLSLVPRRKPLRLERLDRSFHQQLIQLAARLNQAIQEAGFAALFENQDIFWMRTSLQQAWAESLVREIFYTSDGQELYDFFDEFPGSESLFSIISGKALEDVLKRKLEKFIFEDSSLLTPTRLKIFHALMEELKQKGITFSQEFYDFFYRGILKRWNRKSYGYNTVGDVDVKPIFTFQRVPTFPGLYQVQLLTSVLQYSSAPASFVQSCAIEVFLPSLVKHFTFLKEKDRQYLNHVYWAKALEASVFQSVSLSNFPLSMRKEDFSQALLLLLDYVAEGEAIFPKIPLRDIGGIKAHPLQNKTMQSFLRLSGFIPGVSDAAEIDELNFWFYDLLRKKVPFSYLDYPRLTKEMLQYLCQFLIQYAPFPLPVHVVEPYDDFDSQPSGLDFYRTLFSLRHRGDRVHDGDEPEVAFYQYHREWTEVYGHAKSSGFKNQMNHLRNSGFGEGLSEEAQDQRLQDIFNWDLTLFRKLTELASRNPDKFNRGDFYLLTPEIAVEMGSRLSVFFTPSRFCQLPDDLLVEFLNLWLENILKMPKGSGRSFGIKAFMEYFPVAYPPLNEALDRGNLTVSDLTIVLSHIPTTADLVAVKNKRTPIFDPVTEMKYKAEFFIVRQTWITKVLDEMRKLCGHEAFKVQFFQIHQHLDRTRRSASDEARPRIEALLLSYLAQMLSSEDREYFLEQLQEAQFFDRLAKEKKSFYSLAVGALNKDLSPEFSFAQALIQSLGTKGREDFQSVYGQANSAREFFDDELSKVSSTADISEELLPYLLIGMLSQRYMLNSFLKGAKSTDLRYQGLLTLAQRLLPEEAFAEISRKKFRDQRQFFIQNLTLTIFLMFSVDVERLMSLLGLSSPSVPMKEPLLGEFQEVLGVEEQKGEPTTPADDEPLSSEGVEAPSPLKGEKYQPLGFQHWVEKIQAPVFCETMLGAAKDASLSREVAILGLSMGRFSDEYLSQLDSFSCLPEIETVKALYEKFTTVDPISLITFRTYLFDCFKQPTERMGHDDSYHLSQTLSRTRTFAEFFDALAGHLLSDEDTLSAMKNGRPKRERAANVLKAYRLMVDWIGKGPKLEDKYFKTALISMIVLAYLLRYGPKSFSPVFQELPSLTPKVSHKLTLGASIEEGLTYVSTQAREIFHAQHVELLPKVKRKLIETFPDLINPDDVSKNIVAHQFTSIALAQQRYLALAFLLSLFPQLSFCIRADLETLCKDEAQRDTFAGLVSQLRCVGSEVYALRMVCTFIGMFDLCGCVPSARAGAGGGSSTDVAEINSGYLREDFLSGGDVKVLPGLFHNHVHRKTVLKYHGKFNALRDELSTMTSIHQQIMGLMRYISEPKSLSSSRGQVLWKYFYQEEKPEGLSESEKFELTQLIMSVGVYVSFLEENHPFKATDHESFAAQQKREAQAAKDEGVRKAQTAAVVANRSVAGGNGGDTYTDADL